MRYTARVKTIEQELLAALEALDEATAQLRAGGDAVDLTGCLARLDTLAAAVPAEADPQLRHFLRQKSYQKARRLLEQSLARPASGT